MFWYRWDGTEQHNLAQTIEEKLKTKEKRKGQTEKKKTRARSRRRKKERSTQRERRKESSHCFSTPSLPVGDIRAKTTFRTLTTSTSSVALDLSYRLRVSLNQRGFGPHQDPQVSPEPTRRALSNQYNQPSGLALSLRIPTLRACRHSSHSRNRRPVLAWIRGSLKKSKSLRDALTPAFTSDFVLAYTFTCRPRKNAKQLADLLVCHFSGA